MITIQIKNAKEVIKRKKGWLMSVIGVKVLDFEDQVEKELIARIKESLSEEGIEADIKQAKE